MTRLDEVRSEDFDWEDGGVNCSTGPLALELAQDISGNVKGTQTLAKRDLKFAHAIFKFEPVGAKKRKNLSCHPRMNVHIKLISEFDGHVSCCQHILSHRMCTLEELSTESAAHHSTESAAHHMTLNGRGGRRQSDGASTLEMMRPPASPQTPSLPPPSLSRCPLRSDDCGCGRGGLWRYIESKSQAANRVPSFHFTEFPQSWIGCPSCTSG